jgi:serine/threonine protein kinase
MNQDGVQGPRGPEPGGRLRPGAVIDARFTLLHRIGAGASGVVWAARDAERQGDVALKILHPQLSGDAALVAQLAREARVLERLDHPNVARALAFADRGPFTYLAMELLAGQPLNEAIGEHTRARRHFRGRVLAHLVEQICAGVAHAHLAGIVHRDLKPQNILVQPQDGLLHAKVLDFGIARLSEASLFDATTLGRRMGSLFYMSPEQTRGEAADARSDVFALGCILFELLTLRRAWAWDDQERPLPAFDAPVAHTATNSIAAVFSRISGRERPRPSAIRPELPPALDDILARALAVAPADRYPDVGTLARAARSALETLTRQMEAARPDAPAIGPAPGRPLQVVPTVKAQPDLLRPLPPLLADEHAVTDRRGAPNVAPTQALPVVGAPRTQSLVSPDDTTGANPVPATVPFHAAEPDPTVQAPPPGPPDELATALLPGLDTADLELARAPSAPPATTLNPDALGAPRRRRPGFVSGLEEAGPTVWESAPEATPDAPVSGVSDAQLRSAEWDDPTAAAPYAPVQAPMETATTAGARPLKRWGVLMAAAGVAVAVAVTVATLGQSQPAPLTPPPPPEGPRRGPEAPSGPRYPALQALLAEVKANPKDDAAFEALAQGILRASADVPDPELRADIRQIATLSRTVRNVEGLTSCLGRLEAAAR